MLLSTEQFALCLSFRTSLTRDRLDVWVHFKDKINQKRHWFFDILLDCKLKTNKTLNAIALHLYEFVLSMKITTKVMFEITSSMVEEPTDISFHKITKPDTTNTLMGKKLLVGSRLHLRSTFVADGFPRCFPLGNLFSFRNRWCPRTNTRAYFRVKWRLLYIIYIIKQNGCG